MDGVPRTSVPPVAEAHDVLVVGAGQAGLGTAWWLTRTGVRDVVVLDAGEVGGSWLRRWDSLQLFTPRRFSGLPGLRFPAGPTPSPSRLGMAAYLRAYAARTGVPVREHTPVTRLTRDGDGFCAQTPDGPVRARQVVLAVGPFTRPRVPAAAQQLDGGVHQLHSSDYRRPADVPPGRVVVVGVGNSAAQLTVELAATHRVTVIAPREPRFLPERRLGLSVYWWLLLSGLLNAGSDSRVARGVRDRGDAIVGRDLARLRDDGTIGWVDGRVVGAQGRSLRLDDGREVEVSAVLWCTGSLPETGWLDVPGALDDDGLPLHDRGASPVPGLHWMGLPWQTRVNSSIIDGVDRDARRTARRVRDGVPARQE
jgi:putative flavoprotein involved in K+ transport